MDYVFLWTFPFRVGLFRYFGLFTVFISLPLLKVIGLKSYFIYRIFLPSRVFAFMIYSKVFLGKRSTACIWVQSIDPDSNIKNNEILKLLKLNKNLPKN